MRWFHVVARLLPFASVACKSPQQKLDQSWLVREVQKDGQRSKVTIDLLAPVTLEVGVEGKKTTSCSSRCVLDLGPDEIPPGPSRVVIVARDPNDPEGTTSKKDAYVDRDGISPDFRFTWPAGADVTSVQGQLKECGPHKVAAGKTGVVVVMSGRPGTHVEVANKKVTLEGDGAADVPNAQPVTHALTFSFSDLYPLVSAGDGGDATLVIAATAKSADDIEQTERIECDEPMMLLGADFFTAQGRGITWPGDDAAPTQKSVFWGGGFSPSRIVGPAKTFGEVTHLAVIDWQERESKSCGPYTNGLSSSSEYLFPTKYAHHVTLLERRTGKLVADRWFGPPGIYLACPQSITVVDGKVTHPDYEPSREDEERWVQGVLATK